MKVFSSGQPDKSLASIQMLRAVAAISVVVYHAQVMLHHTAGYAYQEHNTGAAGVDIFFIISGFVMYFTNWDAFRKPGASGNFLLRRIIRIVPTYWAYTTLMTALLLFLPHMFQEMKFGIREAIGSYLFLLFVNTNGQVGPNIGVGWTLSFEMYFYLLFSLLLFLPRRFSLVGLGAIFTCGIAVRLFLSDIPPQVQLFTNPLLLEFFLGCCLGALARTNRFPAVPAAIGFCALGVAAIIATGQLNIIGDRFDPYRVFFWGIPAACLLYGAVALEARKVLHVPRFLTALGDSSYSIYLIQVFTLPIVGKSWKVLGLTGNTEPWVAFTAGIAGTVCVAHVLYRIFEKPITVFFRQAIARRIKHLPPADAGASVGGKGKVS